MGTSEHAAKEKSAMKAMASFNMFFIVVYI
jgi:hypothetical protein